MPSWSCFALLSLVFLSSSNCALPPFVSVRSDGLKMNRFDSSDCDSYKSMLVYDGRVYFGGRGSIYQQSPANISISIGEKISWKSPYSLDHRCLSLPQGSPEACHNYIRVIQPYNETYILLCGSMSLRSENIFLHRKTGKLHSATMLDAPVCSYNPEDSVTSVIESEGGTFPRIAATSRRQPQTQMSIIKNLPHSSHIFTSFGPGKMINGNPKFAFSFSATDRYKSEHPMDKLYFVFGESLNDKSYRYNYGARIAQVCANDNGNWRNEFTTFLKVPLLCQTNENEPFVFNLVTHATITGDILYATFNTQSSLFRSAAVCAYRLRDIQDAFHVRKFMSLTRSGLNQIQDSQVPTNPDPGDCAADRNNSAFTHEFMSFMKSHPLVDTTILPFQPQDVTSKIAGPLIAREGETFTKIQVQRVVDLSGSEYHVQFVGTKSGKIIKFLSIPKNGGVDTVQLAELSLKEGEITDLLLSHSYHQLYIQTATKVLQVATGNCQIYTESCPFCDPCRMCVASRDPMCAWNNRTKQCADVRTTPHVELIQSVVDGSVEMCKNLPAGYVKMKVPQYGFPVILGRPVTNPSIEVKWFNVTDCDQALTSSSKSEQYRITPDQRLEITHFTPYDVKSSFHAEYRIGETLVSQKRIIFGENPPISPTPTTSIPNHLSSTLKTPHSTIRSTLSNHPTDGTHNSTGPILPTNSPSTAEVPIFVLVVVIISFASAISCLVFFVVCRRVRRAKTNSGSSKMYDKTESPIVKKNYSSHKSNSSSSINKNPIQSTDDYNEEKMERANLISSTSDGVPVALVSPNQKLPPDHLEFIDGPPAPSMEHYFSSKPNRATPIRTKSVTANDFRIRVADDHLKLNSIRRHKARGTWFIEVEPPSDLDFQGQEVVEMSNLDSGYEKLFGSPSIGDITAVDGPTVEPPMYSPEADTDFLSRPLSPDLSESLMKDARLSFLCDNNTSASNPLLSSSYNSKANRNSPVNSPRNRSTLPPTSNNLKPAMFASSPDNKSPTSTDSTSSTRSYTTPPTSPKPHNEPIKSFSVVT